MRVLVAVTALILTQGSLAAERNGEQFASPLGFAFLEATISDIQKKLGKTAVTEGEHHEDVVCYIWPAPKAIVRFTVGREGIGASFSAARLPDHIPAECLKVPAKTAKQTELHVGGLRLGMTQKQFIAIAGMPTGQRDQVTTVEFSRKETRKYPTTGEPFELNIVIGIEGRFVNDQLTELHVWKTAST